MVQGVIAGGHPAIVRAVEGAEDSYDDGQTQISNLRVDESDVVVGITASGRTPFVIGAMAEANNVGAATIGVTCNSGAPISQIAQTCIVAEVGPEIIAGSTRLKAGTAQKMILNMLSTASMIRLGKVYDNLMVDVKVTNEKLAERATRIVSTVAGISLEDAANYLERSNNEVKAAIVMAVRNVTFAEAKSLIQQAHGTLRNVIGDAT
jgi:N-acetylmuramic acid 6-phosphate etherase